MHKNLVQAEELFKLAALAWEQGNNSGDPSTLDRGDRLCDMRRTQAEALVRMVVPTVEVSYPGLYPTFQVGSRTFYSVIELDGAE